MSAIANLNDTSSPIRFLQLLHCCWYATSSTRLDKSAWAPLSVHTLYPEFHMHTKSPKKKRKRFFVFFFGSLCELMMVFKWSVRCARMHHDVRNNGEWTQKFIIFVISPAMRSQNHQNVQYPQYAMSANRAEHFCRGSQRTQKLCHV